MTRILVTGKNCELSREAFSRAARQLKASSLPTRRAASHSGAVPESAAGGSRTSTEQFKLNTHPLCTDLEPPQPLWLEVHFALREETGLLLILLAIAILTLIGVLM